MTGSKINTTSDDTICAVATVQGGALSVLRMSGSKAFEIADQIFRPAIGRKKVSEQKARSLHYGVLHDKDEDIDEVVLSIFRGPHSFTGQDVVEISCHGSRVICRRALQMMVDLGARMAQPGEFTQRAFLAGKMDLAQAEAVADLVAANSEAARRMALSQLRGSFSHQLSDLREQLLQFSSLIELELDFSEEDVEFADRSQLTLLLEHIMRMVGNLVDSFKIGNAIKNGIPVAIVGKPNVGKSTLLNALLGDDRAIVSDMAGTTRDSIEDTITLGGILFRFIDTAGIRQTQDAVETMGINRTWGHVEKARIVLLVVDSSHTADDAEAMCCEIRASLNVEDQLLFLVVNKVDVGKPVWLTDEWIEKQDVDKCICLSAKNKDGLEQLQDYLVEASAENMEESCGVAVSNIRHYEALKNAQEALLRVSVGIRTGLSGELMAVDLREVTDSLASITGELTSQDVLNNIFAKFCIGK